MSYESSHQFLKPLIVFIAGKILCLTCGPIVRQSIGKVCPHIKKKRQSLLRSGVPRRGQSATTVCKGQLSTTCSIATDIA